MTVIKEFLSEFSHHTQLCYKSALNKYFETINKNPEKYFKKVYEKDKNGNYKLDENGKKILIFKRKYDEYETLTYEEDVKQFWKKIKDFPVNTVNAYMGCVRVFLQEYYVDLPKRTWKDYKNRKKGNRAVVQDIVPTKEQFKQIISHGGILEKAFVTTLLSSGMRIGELCLIKEDDIDFSFKPVKIELKAEYTKTGNRRTVFISDEAKNFLLEWLKVKQAYLNRAVKILNFKNGYTKNINDERVFPMDTNTARQKWNRIVNKSGLGQTDTNTSFNRLKIHPHVTRKFFRTHMAKALGRDYTEYFLGHEEGLDSIYRRYGDDSNKKALGDEYIKGMVNVSIFEVTPDYTDIHKSLAEKDKRIQDLEKRLDDMNQTLLLMVAKKQSENNK
jgi:integrase